MISSQFSFTEGRSAYAVHRLRKMSPGEIYATLEAIPVLNKKNMLLNSFLPEFDFLLNKARTHFILTILFNKI